MEKSLQMAKTVFQEGVRNRKLDFLSSLKREKLWPDLSALLC